MAAPTTSTDRAAETRARVESAVTQLRDAVSDMVPERIRDLDWEQSFEKAGDDVLREIARYAIRAERSPDALTELQGEIRKRKAHLKAAA